MGEAVEAGGVRAIGLSSSSAAKVREVLDWAAWARPTATGRSSARSSHAPRRVIPRGAAAIPGPSACPATRCLAVPTPSPGPWAVRSGPRRRPDGPPGAARPAPQNRGITPILTASRAVRRLKSAWDDHFSRPGASHRDNRVPFQQAAAAGPRRPTPSPATPSPRSVHFRLEIGSRGLGAPAAGSPTGSSRHPESRPGAEHGPHPSWSCLSVEHYRSRSSRKSATLP